MIMSHYVWELISFSVLRSWLPAFFLRRNASFRPQQVWSQWTIWASMPVGEPSLSMQGSLPPLFLSVVPTLSPSLSLYILLFILFSPSVKYIRSLLFSHVSSKHFLHQTKYIFRFSPVMWKLNKITSLSDVNFFVSTSRFQGLSRCHLLRN